MKAKGFGSKYQKKINKLKAIATRLKNRLQERRQYAREVDAFEQMLLKEGRTTKQELALYFKPRKK